MTIKRTASARWDGDLGTGKGTLSTESGALDTGYDAGSRFEQGSETNPEELIGAAHAGCFSMALANLLAEDGHTPESIETDATVELDMGDGPTITGVHLSTRGAVPGIDAGTFQRFAEQAKAECPVSRALGAIEVTLDVTYKG